jgi:isopentenyl diphosphate isomerase/L-lactate dehydrogenase-like FMN-dependent dehydrogenase
MAYLDGELTAKAANQAGMMMILSTLSTKSIEEVSQVRMALNPNVGQLFQLYVHRDRELTRSLMIKGILHGDDAVRVIEHGAQAIVVSNHGGRQLDGAISSIDALSEVVTAVDGRCEY